MNGEGLFGCFSDVPICLVGTFLPCVIDAHTTSKQLDIPCQWYHCFLRTSPYWIFRSYQQKLGGTQNEVPDCVLHTLCAPCAYCENGRIAKENNIVPNVIEFKF